MASKPYRYQTTRQELGYYRRIVAEGGFVPDRIKRLIEKQDALDAKVAQIEALGKKISEDKKREEQAGNAAADQINQWGRAAANLKRTLALHLDPPAAPAPPNFNKRYGPIQFDKAKVLYKQYWAAPNDETLVKYGRACGAYREGKYTSEEERTYDYNRTWKSLRSPEALKTFDDDGQVRKVRIAALPVECQCGDWNCRECSERLEKQQKQNANKILATAAINALEGP